MSVKLSAYVWDGCAASGIKGVKLLVMARLADFSSDEGICWPSVDTIARQVGAGRSTVITAITDLVKDGWLSRKERRQGQRSATNMYTLNVARLRAAATGAYSHHSDSEHSKSGRSESEHSESEHSESGHSGSERSENGQKAGSQGSESGHDPSVTTDPSSNRSCPVSAKPDPEVLITEQAKQVLTHLNQITGSRYQMATGTLQNIRARLAEGFTTDELVLVADYTTAKWAGDLKMADYLRPSTLYQLSKFPGYLSAAGKWAAAGRPECVNGKWISAATSNPPPHWNSEEGWRDVL